MKVRVKFSKYGILKFIGHLDVMRYFQKVNRRAGVEICYSEGFSPHQVMSFASPLGLGLTSRGEYLDMEVKGCASSREMVERMNAVMVEGIDILSFRKLPDDAKTAMSIIAAADYEVGIKEGYEAYGWDGIEEDLKRFFDQETIMVLKKSKKSEREIDLKTMIFDWKCTEDHKLFLKLAQGSVNNLKPELLLETFYRFCEKEYSSYAFDICRLEMYANKGDEEHMELISLEDMGEEIA